MTASADDCGIVDDLIACSKGGCSTSRNDMARLFADSGSESEWVFPADDFATTYRGYGIDRMSIWLISKIAGLRNAIALAVLAIINRREFKRSPEKGERYRALPIG